MNIISCSNICDGVVFSKDESFKQKIEVNFSENYSRTIVPNALNNNSLNYYLFYIDTLSSSINNYSFYDSITLTYNSSNQATANVDFLESVYRFALFACENPLDNKTYESANEKAVLVGYTIADLRSVNSISFYLSSQNLNTKGKLNISLYSNWNFPDYWILSSGGNASVSIGIYDVNSGEPISVGGSNMNPHILSYASEISDKLHLDNYGWGNFGFKKGIYNLIIKFMDNKNNTTFEYSDKVEIYPNQTSIASLNIPNVIEKKPTTPSNFEVSFTNPTSKSENYYIADFSWNDNSNNETEFEIQIADVSNYHSNIDGVMLQIPSVSNDSEWENTVAIYGYDKIETYNNDSYKKYIKHYYDYYNSDSAYNPENFSLLRNKTQAKFFLELGKRYIARIRAVNDAGKSDYAYSVFDSGNCDSINRYRINYYTDNGIVTEYHSQNPSGITINTPLNANWNCWRLGSYYGEEYLMNNKIPYSYTGHENLELFGDYTEIDDGSSAFDWSDGDIILYGWGSGSSNVYFSSYLYGTSGSESLCKNNQFLVIKKSDVSSLRFFVSSSAKNYKTVKLNIKQLSTSNKVFSQNWQYDTKNWTVSIADFEDGNYLATFEASTDSFPNKTFVFTIIFTITN